MSVLLIEVFASKRLRNITALNGSAPFLNIGLPSTRLRSKIAKQHGDQDLYWNELFEAAFEAPMVVELELWRKGFSGDALIAKGTTNLSELSIAQADHRWVELFYKHKGDELSAGLVEVRFSIFDDRCRLLKARSESRCSLSANTPDVAAATSTSGERGLKKMHWMLDRTASVCSWSGCDTPFDFLVYCIRMFHISHVHAAYMPHAAPKASLPHVWADLLCRAFHWKAALGC